MSRNFIIFFFIINTTLCFSQKETNIWYFGDHAGLDFNSGTPVALTNGEINTDEGCASICDFNGNLLFYTDGTWVYNKQHQVMPNGTGLMGAWTTTQSAIIVPKPYYPYLFYIFTLDWQANPNGLRYSIVDMTKLGGLGDVTTKNILLQTPMTEKLTAVHHANGIDVWVIAHKWNSDAFYAYLVTSGGISPPVITNIGVTHTGNDVLTIGYMKASPKGDRLALVIRTGIIEIFDFNNTNGILSNAINKTSPPFTVYYGMDFSPDGKKLYISNQAEDSAIWQFDLSSNIPSEILNSFSNVGMTSFASTYQNSSLQLAADGKIYSGRWNKGYLGVINNPNALGANCNFVSDAIYLSGSIGRGGLPNFIQSYLRENKFQSENFCFGDTSFFTTKDSTGLDSVWWDFGDTTSGQQNFSSAFNTVHIFSSTGYFNITALYYSGGVADTAEQVIFIHPLPFIDLGNDTTLCNGKTKLLGTNNEQGTYHIWSNNSNNPAIAVTTPGTYWVEEGNFCGVARDTITINYIGPPSVNLPDILNLCEGDSVMLNASAPMSFYLWQDSSTASDFMVTLPGNYWVNITNACGADSEHVSVNYDPVPDFDLGSDTTLCPDDSITLTVNLQNVSILWNNNSTASALTVTSPGVYWAQAVNNCPAVRDSVFIADGQIPAIYLGNDTVLCEGQSFELKTDYPVANFLWQNGTTEKSLTVNSAGVYWVQAANNCNSQSDTINVSTKDCNVDSNIKIIIPNIFTPNNDGSNDLFIIEGITNGNWELRIFNRWGNEVFFTDKPQSEGWNGINRINNTQVPSGVYYYILKQVDSDNYYKGNIQVVW